MDYIINEQFDGVLLRNYLKNHLNISRAELTSLKVKDNGIALNGKEVTVRAILKQGDILSLKREDEVSSQGIIPIMLPLDIIYEDENIIALNKPPLMPTHPSHDHQTDTLANALAFYFKNKNTPFVFRSVNRLDRDTSGIVLVAKDKATAFSLSKQMAEIPFEKTYIALSEGVITEPFRVDGYIKRCYDSSMKRCMTEDGGQYSLTEFDPIKAYDTYTVLKARLKTGRTHQIRVHLSSIEHPIMGDTLYGNENGSEMIRRQALHAYSLSFFHPCSNKEITLTAPLPDDILSLTKGMVL